MKPNRIYRGGILSLILALSLPNMAPAQRIQITQSELYDVSPECRSLAETVAEMDGMVEAVPPEEAVEVINADEPQACVEMSNILGPAPGAAN